VRAMRVTFSKTSRELRALALCNDLTFADHQRC
jgi:hypothetical protein